ncbi:lipopolysaccharide biosynthesis protein [Acinetobacter pittii]|uniref:lipopolysaccharide biosynthesis protein n=1 Tax=Acinetobacter pittii TaxID=48296 RepID=UPI0013D82CED|nr:hypothetical protein [Acinetobacter pittii]
MSENRTIFLNTIFLYFRMIVIIGISLYTVRIVYNILGIENFGLFNLIAGFILLFSFLNSAMRSGTQRYLNIAISSNNVKRINATFSVALNVHISIAFIVLIFAETVGFWFFSNKLNIPLNKVEVANFIYQCAIVTTLLSIISVPYQAIIIAKEKMNLYAYITVFEAILKLLVVFMLLGLSSKFNILEAYSILLVVVAFIIFIIYFSYVFRKFREETKYSYIQESTLTKEIVAFSGWNLFGQIAVLSSNQGVALIYNIFLGVTINASLAISQQVTALLNNFVSNLQLAFNPQIVKSFAKNDIERHNSLVLNSSRYSLYLITIIAIPFLLYSEFILRLWLGSDLPKYVGYFSTIVVLVGILDALSGPFWMSAHAKGDIKKYQIIISIIFLLNLPLTYLIFKITYSVYFSFSTYLFISISALTYRIYYFFYKNDNLLRNILKYIKSILGVLLFIFLICFLKVTFQERIERFSLLEIFISLITLEISFLLFVFLFCISGNESSLIKTYVLNKIKYRS